MTADRSPERDAARERELLLSARVTTAAIEVALRETIKRLHSEGHVGYAHPAGRPFSYEPGICPECRLRIVQALAAKELLYV